MKEEPKAKPRRKPRGKPNAKPDAKIHKQSYTSLIGVMLSAQSQDKRTAVACNQLFALADNPEDMLKLSQDQIIEASGIIDAI